MTNVPESKASGCVWWPGLLIWLGVAAVASQLGWSDKTKAVVLIGLLVVALLVAAARQAARDQSASSRPQEPPGRPRPLSIGAEARPSDSLPETEALQEPARPAEAEPTKPAEPEPLKPGATPEEKVDERAGTAEGLAYWLGRGLAILLMVALVVVPVAVVWWLIARP